MFHGVPRTPARVDVDVNTETRKKWCRRIVYGSARQGFHKNRHAVTSIAERESGTCDNGSMSKRERNAVRKVRYAVMISRPFSTAGICRVPSVVGPWATRAEAQHYVALASGKRCMDGATLEVVEVRG